MTRLRTALLLPVLGLALVACSEETEVGAGANTSGLKDKLTDLASTTTAPAGGGAVSGSSTSVLALPTTPPPTTAASTTRPTTATTRAPSTTTTVRDTSFKVAINGDRSGKTQFEPSAIQVRAGTPVRFTNADAVPRSVVSRDAGFRSPDIPPGGTFTYTPTKAGTFQLVDGTRPYATASLQVV